MATPDKATGSGTKALISTDGSTFQKFASVTKLSMPKLTSGTVDVTDLNIYEDNDQMKEFLGDFIEADEVSIEGFVKKTDPGRTAAETAFYSGSIVSVKVVLPPAIGQTMLVNGILTSYQPIGDVDAETGLKYAIGLKPTAKPAMSATSEQDTQAASA